MTENEKLFLNENARIYHVGRPAPVRKKRSRSIVFCAAAAVVLVFGYPFITWSLYHVKVCVYPNISPHGCQPFFFK